MTDTVARIEWFNMLLGCGSTMSGIRREAAERHSPRPLEQKIAIAGHIKSRWIPGDPRCDGCDNGLHADWLYCPYCGEATALGEKHRPAAQLLARINSLTETIIEARRRLAKGRFMWNGPCHECDMVLAKALPEAGEPDIADKGI